MANDITTLAIEIQTAEAERDLRTFNELLSLSSQTAKKMEKATIEVETGGALAQLQALRTGYENLAASARNLNLDLGTVSGPDAVMAQGPGLDESALAQLQEFFQSSAEMSRAMREELAAFSEAMQKLEADTIKVSTASSNAATSMRNAGQVSSEYA